MARAAIFIKYPGHLETGFQTLTDLGRDAKFILETQTLIESIQYVFGTSDYCAHVYSLSWGNVARAAARIQTTLDAKLDSTKREQDGATEKIRLWPRTLTNTALGLGEEFVSTPDKQGIALIERIVQRVLESKLDGDDDVSQERISKIAVETLFGEYVNDRVERLLQIDSALQASNVKGLEEGLRLSLQAHSAVPGAAKEPADQTDD